MVVILIIIAIIISSFIFLTFKINNEHEKEALALSFDVVNYTSGINPYPPESKYLIVDGLTSIKFPVLSTLVPEGPKQISIEGFASLEEYLRSGSEHGLTHLVIDDSKNRPKFLNDVFYHEENYPYLIKIFDSWDHGYKYHLKIYKIDYDAFNSLVTKSLH